MSDLAVSITIVNGQPITTSLDVAEKFGKPHNDVLKAIRRILADLGEGNFSQSSDFGSVNFYESSYINEQGKEQPCYNLTRDAFSLLAMGFTGKKALAWKVKYIEAFNAMEAELLKKARRNGRPRKALPKPEPDLEIRGAAALARLLGLRKELFQASYEINMVLSNAIYHGDILGFPEDLKGFATPLNASANAFFMAINNNLIAVEQMFRAFVAAEKHFIPAS